MDEIIACKICGAEFIFSEGEQKFYSDRGLDSPPKRCPACRSKRKDIISKDKRIVELEKQVKELQSKIGG